MLVFIDFSEAQIDRAEYRRMYKTLKKNKLFSHQKEKNLYFNVLKQENVEYFLQGLENIFKEQQVKTKRCWK